MCAIHTCSVFMDLRFILFLFCLSICVCYKYKTKVFCGTALGPGASCLRYYCAPLACVPDLIGGLAVWLCGNITNQKPKPKTILCSGFCSPLCVAANVQERAFLLHVQWKFLDFRFFPPGHWQFYCKGCIDVALERRNEGDPSCVGKWAVGWAHVLASLGLSRSINFRCIEDSPRFFPPAPSPWIPCSEIIRVEGKILKIQKILLDMDKESLTWTFSTRQCNGIVTDAMWLKS